jgi:RNA 2',3'-cyclic 3'-phosphodiesterase
MRTFLAIPLPAEIKNQAALIQRKLNDDLSNVRWVAPSNMHLTLKFFAETSEESLEKIGQIMLSVNNLFAPFSINILGLGTFLSSAHNRVLWLGIQGGSSLNQLHEMLEHRLEQIGIPREDRPFAPHLTLGRHKQGIFVPGSILRRYESFHCGTFLADRVILYQSRLDPAGAIHIPLRTLPLGGSLPDRDRPVNE